MYELGLGRAMSPSGSRLPATGSDGEGSGSSGGRTGSSAFEEAFSRSDKELPMKGLKWVKARLNVSEGQRAVENLPVEFGTKDAFIFVSGPKLPKPNTPVTDAPDAAVKLTETKVDPAPIEAEQASILPEPVQFPTLVAKFDGSARETFFPGQLEGRTSKNNQSETREDVPDGANLAQANTPDANYVRSGSDDLQHPRKDSLWTAPQVLLGMAAGSPDVGVDKSSGNPSPELGSDADPSPLIFKSRMVQRSATPEQGAVLSETISTTPSKSAVAQSPIQTSSQNETDTTRGWNWFRATGPASSEAASEIQMANDSKLPAPMQSLGSGLAVPSEVQFVSNRSKLQPTSEIGLVPVDGNDASLRMVGTAAAVLPATQPQVAQQVFAQIMLAVEQTKTNEIEITLDPEDLGQVRIVLSPKDGGYDITVIASREQTLDMMRKFGSDLSASFAELGYGHTDLNFESSSDNEGPSDQSAAGDYEDNPATHEDIQPQLHVMHSGLDLKL